MALGSLLAGAAGGASVTVLINAVDNASEIFSKVNKKLLAVGAAMTAVGIAGVAALTSLVEPASNLQESVNAVNVTFGESADEILKIGESAAKSFGMSRNEFNESAVAFSNFAYTIAGEGGDVSQVVNDLTSRTADFASVMNLDLADAQLKIQSGLAGETEALRRYGIDVSAATVKEYAYAHGIAKTGSELTESQKVLARYGLIIEQTDKMEGDFINTSDSLANRQRILDASVTDLKASFGEALLPVLETVVGWVQKIVDWFSGLSEEAKTAIVVVAAIAAGLLILAGVIMIMTAVTTAFTAVNIWWIAILVAVVAAIVAVIAIINNWKTILLAFAKFFTRIGIEMRMIWEEFKDAWEIIWSGVKNFFVSIWNGIVSFLEASVNGIIKIINTLIQGINLIPGISIPLIPEVDFSGIKGEMVDISALAEKLTAEREALRQQLEAEADIAIEAYAKEIGYGEEAEAATEAGTTEVTNINVENNNIYGTDPDEIASAMNSELNNKISV